MSDSCKHAAMKCNTSVPPTGYTAVVRERQLDGPTPEQVVRVVLPIVVLSMILTA